MTLTDLDMLFQLGLMNICRWPVSRKNAHIAYRKTALELSEVMDEDRAVMLTYYRRCSDRVKFGSFVARNLLPDCLHGS